MTPEESLEVLAEVQQLNPVLVELAATRVNNRKLVELVERLTEQLNERDDADDRDREFAELQEPSETPENGSVSGDSDESPRMSDNGSQSVSLPEHESNLGEVLEERLEKDSRG